MRSSIRRGDARLGVWLLAWLAFGAGCGHGLRPVAFYDATELRDERYQASATPPGPVWLRRAVEVRVGVARSPDNARSYLRFHGARLRFDSVDEPRAEVTLTTPAGARLLGVRARVLGHDDEREATPAEVHSEAGRDTVDPDDLRWTLVFAGITAADILEYTADFELATTLVSDARYLSAADGFTRPSRSSRTPTRARRRSPRSCSALRRRRHPPRRRGQGAPRARHATSDWMAMEKERGISVTSSVLQFDYDGTCVNLLDTPGHQDFSEDTYRTLAAADAAVMLIDAAKGVEPQTEKLFRVCRCAASRSSPSSTRWTGTAATRST
jgi:hypothetical protein